MNAQELAQLLNSWMEYNSEYDYNKDGVVNAEDLAQGLAEWSSFSEPTEEPDPVGTPDQLGYDAKAIARWLNVPFSNHSYLAFISVLAYHINGIDKVMMCRDGGNWVQAKEGPEGVYTVGFFCSDSPKFSEIRAIVYPKCGIPRVLQGPLNNSYVGGDNHLNVRNGNHSMFINSGNLQNREYHVSPTGNDDTGDGSIQNPFRTIGGACGVIGNCDGVNLYLANGDYEYSGPKYPKKAYNEYRYLTILPEPGHKPRIISTKLGGLGCKLVHFSEIDFVGDTQCRTPSGRDSYAWFDNCRAIGTSPEVGGGFAAGGWSLISVTNSSANTVRNCFRNATLLVNSTGQFFSDTPIGQDTVVYNCMFTDFVRNSNGDHADVFHWFYTKPGYRENRIISNLNVSRFSLQGWQVNPITGGGQQLDNVALVSINISKNVQNAAGSWWYMDTNHLYMKNVNLVDQPLRWKIHGQDDDDKLTLRNVVIESSFINHVWLPPEVIIR
jgi:hypothetical protein